MRLWLFIFALFSPVAAFGQVLTSNPLDEMKARVEAALEQGGVPFSAEQHRQLALVMEEQRQASERLFGDIMDFSGGPVRGADRDRALAGIQWMNEAFEAKLGDVLTEPQAVVWARAKAAALRAAGGLPALVQVLLDAGLPLAADQQQRATVLYQEAAGQLRRAADATDHATRVEAIDREVLAAVADLLNAAQRSAIVAAAAAAAPADAAGPADGGSGPDAGNESTADSPGLIASLRAIARPTASFSGASGAAQSSDQIAQIRINNNEFTTENFGGRGNRGIEVIQRGGIGDFHGNFSFDFRDESLTARNAFADDKPPFQQRNINANVSGPFIRDLLTASLTFNQNEQENADTVVATMPDGALSFGVVRPEVSRSYSGNGQMQISERHALHFNARYQNRTSENNGVGRFTLPESGWMTIGREMNFELREIWAVSQQLIHEVSLNHFANRNDNQPVTEAVAIEVLDAFRSGGADRRSWRDNRNYTLTNLLWYEGRRLTVKTGTELTYRSSSSFSQDGFLGEFTFSSLDDFRAGRPLTYRVTRGDPLIAGRQFEAGAFLQTDWRVSPRFTFFAGLRYERQTNIDDDDNVDPRLGFAYSLGTSTVLRGGAGLFHQNLGLGLVQDVRRLDGARQFEIVVSNPAYPDPFAGGSAQVVPPSSRRLFAPDLAIPYEARTSLSIERTLPWNLSVDASYDFSRGVDRFRTRNLNAPRPGTTVRPNPDEGNVLQLESKARSRSHRLRLGVRQRLSFLTYNASYTLSSDLDDGEGPFWQPMNNYDPGADWGRAGYNQKHRYNFTINSEAPFGTLFTVEGFGHSGNPYNITTGEDDNHDQQTSDRPPGLPRNSGNGPRFFNVNMTLSKTFRLRSAGSGETRGGGALLSVYANMNNAFNLVNRRNPSGVLTSEYFGIPTSAAPARDVEIGIRYQF